MIGLGVLKNSIRARIERYFRTRQYIVSLKSLHQRELTEIPVNEWALAKRRHAEEIFAAKAGRFNVIDRRSWAYPYIPEALHRLNQPILKNTPYNLRRFSETPVPRSAINLIKNAMLGLKWHVVPTEEALKKAGGEITPELQEKVDIITQMLKNPNDTDSWRSLTEAEIEDLTLTGAGCLEPRLTPDYRRPVKMWPVDATTIRIYADWTESTPEKPHYAQLTGLKGERGIISFLDDELIYMRQNVRSSTPFGLGDLEVGFNAVNAFLGAQDMAARSAADQIHKTWLWFENTIAPSQLQTVRRHVQNEIEGQGKLSLISGMKKPEIIEATPVTPEDLMLDWQQFLLRIIGLAFGLSPIALNLERDVNRNTSEVMTQTDFKRAVVPKANIYAEYLNRQLIWKKIGWRDIQFEWIGLEDPDAQTQQNLNTLLYKNNAITPDEIRQQLGKPPLPGKWGTLTLGQYTILQMAARAEGQKSQQPGQGQGQQEQGQISPEEIAQMDPEMLEDYRQAGLIPPAAEQEPDEQQEQGVLTKFSQQIEQYLEQAEEQEEADNPQAGKKNRQAGKLQDDQKKRFKDSEHQFTREEQQARDIEKRRQYNLRTTPRNPRGKKDPNYTGRSR